MDESDMFENVDFLMEQADAAAALEGGELLWGNNRAPPQPDDDWADIQPVRVRAADEHVCRGPLCCEHIVLNRDRIWVCEASGVCWGGEHVEELFDNQTSRRSSNPDEVSGCITFVSFRNKRDAAALSESATLAATNFEDAEHTQYEAPCSPQREAPKRGARCVGEAKQPRPKRRSRTCKRDVDDARGTRALVEDAVTCINSEFLAIRTHRRALSRNHFHRFERVCLSSGGVFTTRSARECVLTVWRCLCPSQDFYTVKEDATLCWPTARTPSWRRRTPPSCARSCTDATCASACLSARGPICT